MNSCIALMSHYIVALWTDSLLSPHNFFLSLTNGPFVRRIFMTHLVDISFNCSTRIDYAVVVLCFPRSQSVSSTVEGDRFATV